MKPHVKNLMSNSKTEPHLKEENLQETLDINLRKHIREVRDQWEYDYLE